MSEPSWRIIDHTADIRVEVYGTDLKQLFVNAAVALTELLAVGAAVTAETDLDISLESPSIDELLVDWLREILFYAYARDWIVVQALIEDVTDTTLTARVSFRTRRDEEQSDLEIKAVTYHGLSVEKTEKGYCARILFDI